MNEVRDEEVVLPGFVVTFDTCVASLEGGRLADHEWEALFDRLMAKLLERERVGLGGYTDSLCSSTKRSDHHALTVGVRVAQPSLSQAFKVGTAAIQHALYRLGGVALGPHQAVHVELDGSDDGGQA
jgi:acyl-CoA hydrolase